MSKNKGVFVVVLGWWKALDSHVQKYANLYNRLGFKATTYTAPGSLFFQPWKYDTESKKVFKSILKQAEEANCDKIVFHSFSNNGCVIFHSISRIFNETSTDIKVVGGVFDSCPGVVDAPSFYKALFAAKIPTYIKYLSILPYLPATALIVTSEHPVLYSCGVGATYLAGSKALQYLYEVTHTQAHFNFKKNFNDYQELYLFSESDTIVNYKVIEAAIDKINKKGGKTEQVKFDDTNHCAHFPKQPMKYSKTCAKFIKKFMP